MRSALEASLYVPVAVNCWVRPAAMDGLAGVTAMLLRVAALTVSRVLPTTRPLVALIVARAGGDAGGEPVELIVARGIAEAQVTGREVRVEASLYVPVAVNCWVRPAAMDGLAGVTAMLLRVAAVTVSRCAPPTRPRVALIVARAGGDAGRETARADRRGGMVRGPGDAP